MNHLVPALVAAAPLLAQPSIPATPAGQMLRAYLEIYNSGEASRIAQFASEHCSAKELDETPAQLHGAMVARIRGRRGELFVKALDAATEHAIRAILVDANRRESLSLSFSVTAEAPHRLENIVFRDLAKRTRPFNPSGARPLYRCGEMPMGGYLFKQSTGLNR